MVIKRVSTYIHLQSFSIGNDIVEVIGPGKVKGQIVVFSKLRSFSHLSFFWFQGWCFRLHRISDFVAKYISSP